MKYFDFYLLFLLLFINLNCVLNANKIKNHKHKEGDCVEFNKENKKEFIQKISEDSKISNTTHFLFFSSKINLINY